MADGSVDWEEWFGPSDAAALTGNGGLTVCLNPFGRMTACRWPGPLGPDQVLYRMHSHDGAEPWHGAMWGVRIGGETRWLTGAPWTAIQRYAPDCVGAIETEAVWPDSALKVLQRVFVHPVHDVLVSQITVSGADGPVEAFWYANFSPCGITIPELPVADLLFDAHRDFAVFADRHVVYAFRPRQPGAADWERAEACENGAAMSAAFGEGTWIGYASDAMAGFQCGVENTASCAYAQACRGQLDGNTVAVGSCNSVVTPVMALVDGAWTATVVAAFGASRPAVDEALNAAREAGPAALFGETAAYWRDTLAGMPTVKDESLNRLARQCVATVLQCMDRNRGAIAQPPVSLDEPRDGFWLTLALDMAGFRDRAEAHTLFYGSVARREAALGMPLGSVPAASAADCLEGLPHVALNTDAAAWILGSFRQHAAFLDGDARKLYVSRVRETVQALGDFLVRWTDGQTGAPLASFDTGLLRDAQSIEKLMTALMGVGGAIALAEEAGQPVPPRWRQRNREMMALALVQCVDKDGRWKLDRLPPFWLPEIVASHAEPEAAAARRPGALEQLSGEAAARALCDLALAWRNQESRIETLRGVLKTVLARALERDSLDDGVPVPPDAVRAALLYIAIAEIAPK